MRDVRYVFWTKLRNPIWTTYDIGSNVHWGNYADLTPLTNSLNVDCVVFSGRPTDWIFLVCNNNTDFRLAWYLHMVREQFRICTHWCLINRISFYGHSCTTSAVNCCKKTIWTGFFGQRDTLRFVVVNVVPQFVAMTNRCRKWFGLRFTCRCPIAMRMHCSFLFEHLVSKQFGSANGV